MYFLAISTAGLKTETALLKRNGIHLKLISENSWISKNDEAEKLFPAVHELLKSNKVDYPDLTGIVSIKGPGSFTGLRIGVTVVNTLSWLLKIPAYTLNTFEIWWYKNPEAKENTALLIYAGSGGVYFSKIKEKNIGTQEKLLSINEILDQNNIKFVFGDILETQKNSIRKAEFIDIKKSLGETLEKIPLNKLTVEKLIKPLYIKPPAISESKKSIFC